jgi:hypothetical protein
LRAAGIRLEVNIHGVSTRPRHWLSEQ